jgi:hypothetical protein
METHQTFNTMVADMRAVVLLFWRWIFSAADCCATGIEIEWGW